MKFTHANRTWQQQLRRNIITALIATAALAVGYALTLGLIGGYRHLEAVMQPRIGPSTYAQTVGPHDRYLPIAPGRAALVTPGATIAATIRKGN